MNTFRLSLLTLALAACSVDEKVLVDAQQAIDAEVAPDAELVPPPVPGLELAPAAGRLTGGTWTVDVQLGSIHQEPSSGGTWQAQTGAPLNP